MKRWMIALSVVVIVVGVLNIVVPTTPIVQESITIQPVVRLGIADQVAAVRSGCVHVRKEGVCQGSGFAVAPNIICTAKHVTDGTYGTYTVTADDGLPFKVRAVVEEKEHDLAYLLIDGELPVLPIASMDTVRVGDPVFIVGSPLGFENFNSVSLGILACKGRDLSRHGPYGWQVLFQSTSPAYPGNSGGPVFNLQGMVIGVLVAGYDATLNYSVPADFIDVEAATTLFRMSRFQVVDDTFTITADMWADYQSKITLMQWEWEWLWDQQQAELDKLREGIQRLQEALESLYLVDFYKPTEEQLRSIGAIE